MIFLGKRLIAQYEARIQDLQKQIADLRSLALPRGQIDGIPLVTLEADAILSQKEGPIELSEEEIKRLQDAIHERDRILGGNY